MKLSLLFVNGHLNAGGVERSLVDLLCHLDYSQYEVDLLLIEGLGDYILEVPKEVNIIYKDIRYSFGPLLNALYSNFAAGRYADVKLRIIKTLADRMDKKILRRIGPLFRLNKQYDCAIAYRTGFCADIVAYAVQSRKKVLWWHHGACNYSSKEIESANLEWLRFDNIVTVSEGCRKMLMDNFSFPKDRYEVIPNMIDINRITLSAGKESPYNSDESVLKLLTVGRLSPEKQIVNVPIAARMLLDRGYHDFHWFIVGDGDEKEKIVSTIKELELNDYVELLGSMPNPYPFIKFADILIHTSYVESQSITVLEAMALHTPCVVTESMGPREFMKDGVHGIMVGHGGDCLVEGILRMRDLSSIKMTESAYKVVERFYTPQTTLRKFTHLIMN